MRVYTRRTSGWAAVAFIACSACSEPRRAPPEAGPAPRTGVSPTPTSPKGPIAVDLSHNMSPVAVLPMDDITLPFVESQRVSDAGRAPRTKLVYQLHNRRDYSLATTLTTRQATQGGAYSTPQPVSYTEAFSVNTPGRGTGPMLLDLDARPAQATGELGLAYTKRWRDLLANRSARLEVTAQGSVGQPRFADDIAGTHSAAASAEWRQRMIAWIVPLPVEPIGIGAKWRVVTVLKQGGLVVKQTADYELLRQTGPEMVIRTKLLRVGEQQINVEESAPGQTLELIAMLRRLEGDLTISPSAALPVHGDLTFDAMTHAKLSTREGSATELIFDDHGTVALRSTSK